MYRGAATCQVRQWRSATLDLSDCLPPVWGCWRSTGPCRIGHISHRLRHLVVYRPRPKPRVVVARRSQHSSSARNSGSHTSDLTSKCVALLSHEGSRPMLQKSSLRTLAVAAAGVSLTAALAVPAVASATVPAVPAGGYATDWGPYGGYGPPHPRDWDHPEWGPGWNNGFPARGWVPAVGWVPPRTGPRPLVGIPRPAGLHRRGGSDLVPDHFSICSTRCAARSPRSEPAPSWGQAQSRSKIELTMSSPMPMPAPVMIANATSLRSNPHSRALGYPRQPLSTAFLQGSR